MQDGVMRLRLRYSRREVTEGEGPVVLSLFMLSNCATELLV